MASQPSPLSRYGRACSVHASIHVLTLYATSLSLSYSCLQELYIAFNNVSDVSLVAMLPRLEVLDIERYISCDLAHLVGSIACSHVPPPPPLCLSLSPPPSLSLSVSLSPVLSNNLTEEDQLGYLALCSSLSAVNLEGNPVASFLAQREVRSMSQATL